MARGLERDEAVRAYTLMARMRAFEQAQVGLWEQGLISGELHTGIGEEGIVAGVVMHLRDDDATALDHRPTPALVGRGADREAILLEVLGSEEGLNGGWGGHMHLYVPERYAASDGIVGTAGPIACGLALAGRRQRPGSVAVAFFGEGAMNQGMLLESLNLAVAWRLPVVFVCKDSDWSITTLSRQVTGGRLVQRARGFGLPATAVDGSRVEVVHAAAGRLVARARAGRGPGFLLAHCHRPGGHMMDDAMLRPLREPGAQARELGGPLAAAATARPGAPASQRARGLAGLTGRIATLAWHYGTRRGDPLPRARRLVGDGVADRIDATARADTAALVARALERTGGGAP